MERVDGAQARLKPKEAASQEGQMAVERVDGAQARLKLCCPSAPANGRCRGKGGWGSGEIETGYTQTQTVLIAIGGKGGWGSGEIETPLRW